MKTIQTANLSKNQTIAIVKGSEIYRDPRMLAQFKDHFIVITYYNFNDGLKDNLEGIVTVGILNELPLARIIFNSLLNQTVETLRFNKFENIEPLIAIGGRSFGKMAAINESLKRVCQENNMVIITASQGDNNKPDMDWLTRYNSEQLREMLKIPEDRFGKEENQVIIIDSISHSLAEMEVGSKILEENTKKFDSKLLKSKSKYHK